MRIAVGSEEVGKLSWELPARLSNYFHKLPPQMQDYTERVIVSETLARVAKILTGLVEYTEFQQEFHPQVEHALSELHELNKLLDDMIAHPPKTQ